MIMGKLWKVIGTFWLEVTLYLDLTTHFKQRPNQNNSAYFDIIVIQGCFMYLGLLVL